MTNNSRIHSTYDNLYDTIKGDRDDFITEEDFCSKLDELIDIGLIETSLLDDYIIYSARYGLEWADFVHIDDSIKKSILTLLVQNPKTFFILQNTQKGKMKLSAQEIQEWSKDRRIKAVGFMIVANDSTLADQSADGLQKVFGEQRVRVFLLSSTKKITYEEIKTYIDAYANDVQDPDREVEYPMPVIALLSNPKQFEKMLKLLNHIDNKIRRHNSPLRYGIIWDEADITYPSLRNKEFSIDTNTVSFYSLIEQNIGLYRLGFVSATDGNLLDEEYPECSNAYLYPVVLSPEDREYYRALHTIESQVNIVNYTSKHTQNSYATEIIENNKTHFTTPIKLPSGELYYRKIIVNSNSKIEDMKQFAIMCNSFGMYSLVFNGYGGTSIKIYRPGFPVEMIKTKGKKFNEVLFFIYKKYKLNDKPIVIIGRRKVDRGLGFHYSPRTNDEFEISVNKESMKIKNRDSLIWTDMILGRIDDKNVAVQKAGRLAGIISNSPQYPGNTYYWTDENTEKIIRRHNTIVDVSNNSRGCSVLQAVRHAENLTPIIQRNHTTPLDTFIVYDNEDTVKKVIEELGYRYIAIKPSTEGPNIGFRETRLNRAKAKCSLIDAINAVKNGYGNAGSDDSSVAYRSYYPCYKNINDPSSLHFVILIRPNDRSKTTEIKLRYPAIEIPQIGEF